MLGEPGRLSESRLQKALPEVIVEAIHRQEVNVRQKDIWRLRVGQGHVAQEVDGVELPLLVDDVVGDVAAGTEHLRGLGVAQELLGLRVRHVQRQADGARPVFADGLQHLQPAKQRALHEQKTWPVGARPNPDRGTCQ